MYAPDLLRKLAAGSKDKQLKKNFKLGLQTLDKLFHLAAVSCRPHNVARCLKGCSSIDVMRSYRFVVTNLQAKDITKRKQGNRFAASVFTVSVYNLQMWISAGDSDNTIFKKLIADDLTLEVMYDRPDEAMMCVHHRS